jgi:hypothetical protein
MQADVPRTSNLRLIMRLAAFTAATLMLLAPAIWNGFPLLQYDTGGYIARWYEGTLEVSRSTVYGLFLDALARPNFWPAVIVQSAATVWVIALVLRVYKLGMRTLLVTVAALTIFTTLPWLTGILLTDIFFGISVLALYLVLLQAQTLRRWERVALYALIAFAAASHSATLLVLLMLLCAAALARLVTHRLTLRCIGYGFGALALGAAMLVAANFAIVGRLAWTPGGIAIPFGRMLQVGIVARYLDDHCPDPRLRLCAHRAELPRDADVFFWGESVFDRLGRFEGMANEMRTIVIGSLLDYPWWQFEAALAGTAEQLVSIGTGYGVNTEIWHTYGMIQEFLPAMLPAMKAARQQKGELDFTTINKVHRPIAWASMFLLFALLARALMRGRFSEFDWLIAVAALAILANAVVCGALSNPHDRYGARAVWLAPFVLLLVPWILARRAKTAAQ